MNQKSLPLVKMSVAAEYVVTVTLAIGAHRLGWWAIIRTREWLDLLEVAEGEGSEWAEECNVRGLGND